MFLFLHRLMKAGVVALWLGMAFLVWQQRERGRPLVDLYEAWRDAGYQRPPPLPRLDGTVVKVLAENSIQLKTTNGLVFNLGLAGAGGMDAAAARDPVRRRFADETRGRLAARLEGQPVSFAHTLLQANHTGMGFAYVGAEPVNVTTELVADGRVKLVPQALRVLPLREQLTLRAADRLARAEHRGVWAAGPAADAPAER